MTPDTDEYDEIAPAYEEPKPRVGAMTLLRRLWREYLAKHWRWLIVASILMVIEGSTLGILSYALQPMFDRVLIGNEEGAIHLIGGGIMALFCIRAVAGVIQRMILTRVGQLSTTELQTDLVTHLMSLDSAYFHDAAPGALMERVQGDTAAVQNVWRSIIQGAARDVISLIVLGVVVVMVDPVWTAVALIGIPVLVLPVIVLQHYLRRKALAIREISGQRSVRLSEIFLGIDLIKLNRLEAMQANRFKGIVSQIVSMRIKAAGGQSLLPGLLDVMTGVGFFAVLVFGSQEIVSGEKTVGQFMSFFAAMALAFQPMRRLANMAGIVQTTAASLERIFTVMDLRPEITSPASPKPPPSDADIVLRDVQFSYGASSILNGTSFTVEAGTTVALVGPSGAGKSTIFNLLTRLADPKAGEVTIGGIPIRDFALEDLRALYSVVTQEAPLFDETLRDNIVLNRNSVTDDQLRQVLDDANLTETIAAMPQGLDTPAGPKGKRVSGGQRQRIAIARALIRDTPILLLDEATSALDAQSEAAVQGALKRLSSGRTTIVIAHRLSTVREADKIVVMDHGRVIEEGTHEELLARDGMYAGLYRLQFRDAEPSRPRS